jgi:hypothetical protein
MCIVKKGLVHPFPISQPICNGETNATKTNRNNNNNSLTLREELGIFQKTMKRGKAINLLFTSLSPL